MEAWVARPTRVVQQCPYWCWAASISMLFATNGHPLNQMKIVKRSLGGALACVTGHPRTIGQDLSLSWTDDNGDDFDSDVTAAYDVWNGVHNLSNVEIISELTDDRPLLYCNQHHAMLLVAVDYVMTPMGPNIFQAGVIDPYPSAPGFHTLSKAELYPAHIGGQLTFLAAVSVT